ncbi:MAG: methyltransferase domain-containing protein [Candidatus Diapherotrites archaeon]
MELEEVNCPLCDSKYYKKIFSAKDINSGIKGRFSYVKCSNCDLVFMNPRPKKKFIPLLYPKDYYAYSEKPSNLKRSFNSFVYRKKQEALRLFSQEGFSLRKIINYPFYALLKEFDHTFIALKQKGSILDVGCGTGTYLLGWREQGWNVTGIELNKSAAEYARKK